MLIMGTCIYLSTTTVGFNQVPLPAAAIMVGLVLLNDNGMAAQSQAVADFLSITDTVTFLMFTLLFTQRENIN